MLAFDCWIPPGRSAIAEVYPALWSRSFAREERTGDQHGAFSVAAWLSRVERDGSLAALLRLAARTRRGADRGLDIGRIRLDPWGQEAR
jgi:hypothetical protein